MPWTSGYTGSFQELREAQLLPVGASSRSQKTGSTLICFNQKPHFAANLGFPSGSEKVQTSLLCSLRWILEEQFHLSWRGENFGQDSQGACPSWGWGTSVLLKGDWGKVMGAESSGSEGVVVWGARILELQLLRVSANSS